MRGTPHGILAKCLASPDTVGMATRTIRLKLVVPRGADPERRQALWASHAAINEAARYYEQQLLLMRQREYETEAGVVTSDNIAAELRFLVTKAQGANGKSPGVELDEASDLLHRLYELIVPSALEGETGKAQEAGGFIGPLTDPKSTGYLGVFEKLDRVEPNWAGALNSRRDQVRAAGDRWLATKDGKACLKVAKKSAKWVKQHAANNPSWPQHFLDSAKKRKSEDGTDIPDWVAGLQEVDDTLLDAANTWLETPTGKEWMSDTGRKATWRNAAIAKEPSWPLQFIAKLEDLKEEAAKGAPPIVKRLRELGALPLFNPLITPQIYAGDGESARSGLTPWDRLAFRLAVGHLLSWESWCHRAVSEHAARIKKLQDYRAENLTSDLAPAMARLDEYERERSTELSNRGLGESIYCVQTRGIRGWSDLQAKWASASDKSEAHLKEIAAAEQARLGNKFGDPHVFSWLAESNNHIVWRDSDKPLRVRAVINAMQGLVDRSKERALQTQPDARLHPVWMQWEPLGGANLKNYEVSVCENEQLEVKLPLLKRRADRLYEEKTFGFPIAPSGQLRKASFSSEGGTTHRVSYENDAGETHQATLQSSDLYLHRHHLEQRREEVLEDGDIGPAYFKFVLDVEPLLPAGWDGKKPAFLLHFNHSKGKKSGVENEIKLGSRVLSVDLGLRVFAACAVFELKKKRDAKRLSFAVNFGKQKAFAVHERSFQLKLPGEAVGGAGEAWRQEQLAQIRALRRVLFRYRSVMNLALEADAKKRHLKIAKLVDELADEAGDSIDERNLLGGIDGHTAAADPIWADEVKKTLAEYRKRLARIFRDWRAVTKRAPAGYVGKSMWAVDYFTNVRRLLQSWSLLGRETGNVRRADRDAEGIFAYRLLHHLDGIKEDRLKTGADLIVQAARGFIRDESGKWSQRYKSCEVVLFEDLSRYRMRTDRPRRENSQLMKWAHRKIPDEVKGQGELFGLHVGNTSAQFSSRYCAATGAPGIRALRLTASNLASDFMCEALKKNGLDPDRLQAGDLVPWHGGSRFIAIDKKGHLFETDADINAAQNLQRRYWLQHGDAFRLPCRRVTTEDGDCWVPSSFGARIRGALGGAAVLIPTGHDSGSCELEKVSDARLRKLGGGGDAQQESVGDEEQESVGDEELEALNEELIELSDDRETYFRDPSGTVLLHKFWYPSKIFWSIVNNKSRSALPAIERQ